MYHIVHKKSIISIGILVLAVSLSVLLLLASRSTVSAQGRPDVFHSNGESGIVYWSDGNLYGYVQVYSSGNAQNPEVFLYYVVYNPCCNSESMIEGGYGQIPRSDLTGSGTGTLRLNTNTNTNPSFTYFKGSGGVLAIDWQKKSEVVTRFTGNSQTRSSDMLIISNGTSEWSLASAQGSVVGSAIAGVVSADMGMNHNLNITVQKGP